MRKKIVLGLVLITLTLFFPQAAFAQDDPPTLPTIPTPFPLDFLPEETQLDVDLFWDMENWNTTISVARTFMNFINRYQYMTLFMVMALLTIVIKIIIRVGTGSHTVIYASPSKDEE